MLDFKRGSEWRRWDLHIHTPGTVKNDQYEGSSIEEKWNKFYEDIHKYIDETDPLKNIIAIGITDYLSIENYKKVIEDNKLPSSIKLILPNIELRMNPLAANSPINIHLICNPEIVSQLESRFFSKLSYRAESTNYSATKLDLIRFGKSLDDSLNNQEAYKKGVENFIVQIDNLKEIFDADSDLRDNIIIAVSNSSNDGASGLKCHSEYLTSSGSQMDATRQTIYKFSEFIFSSNPNDVRYFLGKKENCPIEKVIKECGSLKPCIHGCDAHKNIKIFEPDNARYCWIKADPTFNGLKQIKYEPEERVRIQETKPETKVDYWVIDSVEIDDSYFQKELIYFNDKLNCIIGGKSTGKSILLQNLARTINKDEVEKVLSKTKNKTMQISNMRVYWADGSEGERKIVYIPQTYLNNLSEEQQEKTEIDTWIEEILLNTKSVSDAKENFNIKMKEYRGELEKKILDLTSKYSQICEVKEKISNIGTKSGIEKEIEKYEKSIKEISKNLDYSERDLKKYENISYELKKIKETKTDLIETKNLIEKISSLVREEKLNFLNKNDYVSSILDLQKKILEDTDKIWLIEKNNILEKMKKQIDSLSKNIQKKDLEVKKLEQKIKVNESIIELTKKIQKEKEKLVELSKENKKLNTYEKSFDDFLSEIVLSIDFYKEVHNEYKNIINIHTIAEDDIEFFAEVPFRQDAFLEKMSEIYNNRNPKFKENFEDFSEDKYDKSFIRKLILQILENKSLLKSSYTIASAISSILSDWFNTVYRVKMGNDSISQMSPGKKALVFLKILISLSETQCPILIDQPEDDLDNRSIFEDLVLYIKNKKKERQIIIVTHNANLVLGCDAEEIIVANQDGVNCPNNNSRFEYRSGSIENDRIITDQGVGILNQKGIQHHICDILEGGETAFMKRKNKYNIV